MQSWRAYAEPCLQEGTTITLTSVGSIAAGTALSVVVPASAGIRLPYAGMCTVADVVSCLVESDAAAGPIVPTSISKHHGVVGTSHLCGGDPPLITAPKLVHLGHDFTVEWQRPHDDTELSTDLRQRSQRTDWVPPLAI